MHKEQKEERASVSLRISKKIQQMIPLFRGCEFHRYTEVHEGDEASHGSSCVGVQGSIKGQNFGMKGYIYLSRWRWDNRRVRGRWESLLDTELIMVVISWETSNTNWTQKVYEHVAAILSKLLYSLQILVFTQPLAFWLVGQIYICCKTSCSECLSNNFSVK